MKVCRFNRMAEPEKEVNIPARDQVHLKAAKPNPPAEIGHVEIEKDKAKLSAVVQGPEVPKEVRHIIRCSFIYMNY